ncbi:MAG: hypothetical protein FJW30_11835 [Acidobacteria bacterium]|nr:hypothetical protein [Acidobacteriota bacterium]
MKIAALLFTLTVWCADEPLGAQLYRKHCASCHDAGGARIPTQAALRARSGGSILRSLESGVMRTQGAALNRSERRAISTWLGRTQAVAMVAPNRCRDAASVPLTGEWTRWGGGAENMRFQPTPGLRAEDVPKLQLRWAFGVPDGTNVRSQPAVFGGRLIFGSQEGVVYSLDAKTGCSHWATEVGSQVRTGIVVDGGRVYLGDVGGMVYALDFETGKPLWQRRVDDHPAALITATPAVSSGRVYVGVASFEEALAVTPSYVCCTFRGSVAALDAASGQVIWKTYTVRDPARPGQPTKSGARTLGPSGAGVWASPTVDERTGIVYAVTGDNYSDPPTVTSDALLAFRASSGELLWSKQYTAGDAYNGGCPLPDRVNCPDSAGPDHDFGAPPQS